MIIAILALAGVYLYDKSTSGNTSGTYGVTITVQIFGQIKNSTMDILASYDPDNFTAYTGEVVTLNVQNTDNLTHGLAIPKLNLDTGPMKPNATVTLSFTPTTAGNYTFDEPSADCGGGSCDSGQAMSGWFLVSKG